MVRFKALNKAQTGQAFFHLFLFIFTFVNLFLRAGFALIDAVVTKSRWPLLGLDLRFNGIIFMLLILAQRMLLKASNQPQSKVDGCF
jgi:hypothetical protein